MRGRKRGLITIKEIRNKYLSGETKRSLSLESGLPLAKINKILKGIKKKGRTKYGS